MRQRIEAEPARVGWRNGWRWLVPAMAAAAVITAAIVMRQPRTNEPVRVSRVSEATRPIAATPPVAPKPVEKAVVLRNPVVSQKPVLAAAELGTPEVITDQGAILRALWARVKSRTKVEQATATAGTDEIVVPPIEIAPIVVTPLGMPAGLPPAIQK